MNEGDDLERGNIVSVGKNRPGKVRLEMENSIKEEDKKGSLSHQQGGSSYATSDSTSFLHRQLCKM